MKTTLLPAALLLFLSGMCALIFQVAWLREFRLVFGATTAASAAVLAIFMGGLGLGNALLGKRADRHSKPLLLYAQLLLLIALSAAISPFLIELIRAVYIRLGGQMVLGFAGATAVRLLLSSLVLGLPTILMGGTLPAAIKAVTTAEDSRRRDAGMLYGVNTLGAVMGAALSTFFMLQFFGTRMTLWLACLVNLFVALAAWALSRTYVRPRAAAALVLLGNGNNPFGWPSVGDQSPRAAEGMGGCDTPPPTYDRGKRMNTPPMAGDADEKTPTPVVETQQEASEPAEYATTPAPPVDKAQPEAVRGETPAVQWDTQIPHRRVASFPPSLVYAAAGIVGFAFFLMELVWYRMLGPILGGTTFTFGLILAVALLGIGLGGAAYTFVFRYARPTLRSLALVCGLEAACIAFPFALGDRLAIHAAALTQMNTAFGGLVLGWAAIAAIVILPAAFVSGVQFPLLIALAGRGDKDVGKQVGFVFACNTVGAILGSLAGGFGLLPILTAVGTWCAVVMLLAILGLAALVISYWIEPKSAGLLLAAGVLILAPLLTTATGPTAVWRHGGIGGGRAQLPSDRSPNSLRDWMHVKLRRVVWEAEGVEASIAITHSNSISFLVNGVTDGNAIADARTQIMLGLVGGLLHPEPKKTILVGLGSGETAGWLAEIQSMERVDVVELEPAVCEMARRCASLNFNVLEHPKVHLVYNDAREVLLTLAERYRYDLVVSIPSDPRRAGVANLYTQEFYQACRSRLNQGGLFLQWLKGYEIDEGTISIVLRTLRSVFPQVEIWEPRCDDILFLCSMKPIRYPIPALRRRIAEEPFKSAMAICWRGTDLEAFLAHYLAGPRLADDFRPVGEGTLNTDDRNRIEYGLARIVGRFGGFSTIQLRETAIGLGAGRPPVEKGSVDWELVQSHRQIMNAFERRWVWLPPEPTAEHKTRAEVLRRYLDGNTRGMITVWEAQPYEPICATEVALLAWAYANNADNKAKPLLERLKRGEPTEAEAIRAFLLWRQGRPREATAALETAWDGLRSDPWAMWEVIELTLELGVRLAQQDRSNAERLYAAIREPFAAYVFEEKRRGATCLIAEQVGPAALAASMETFEPYVVWAENFLGARLRAYTATNHRFKARAEKELQEYLRQASDKSNSGPPLE